MEQAECYGFNFGSNGGSNGGGQQSSPAGFFWNGFRAFPQSQVQSIPVQIKFEDTNEAEEDPEVKYVLLLFNDDEKYFGHC